MQNQLEGLRQELARLRGQNEVLQNTVGTLQKQQKDYYADLDARLKKLEPQQASVEDRQGTSQPPKAVAGSHFGATLVSYVLYQYHHCHVTQPLLCEQLREWGIEISSGQMNALLQEDKQRFHDEKEGLLSTGLALSAYVTVDGTGTRHQGCNGYVTHIGNEHFAWFKSTSTKSRINFLELLAAGHGYQVNDEALCYMKNIVDETGFQQGTHVQSRCGRLRSRAESGWRSPLRRGRLVRSMD